MSSTILISISLFTQKYKISFKIKYLLLIICSFRFKKSLSIKKRINQIENEDKRKNNTDNWAGKLQK